MQTVISQLDGSGFWETETGTQKERLGDSEESCFL